MKRKIFFITLLMLFCTTMFGQQHWTMSELETTFYQTKMSYYTFATIDGVDVDNNDIQIAAFHGNELRGCAFPSYNGNVGKYIFVIDIYGTTPGDQIYFKLYKPDGNGGGVEYGSDFTINYNYEYVPTEIPTIDFYNKHWNYEYVANEYMQYPCVIKIDGVLQERTNLELAAFCGEELRGVTRPQKENITEGLDIYMASLKIEGTNNETISFKLYDPTINSELSTDKTILFDLEYGNQNVVEIDFKNNAVAQIGNNYYTTLEAALAATMDNDVVTIIKSTNETIGVPAGNNVTIKPLEGVELSGGAGGSYYNKSVTFDGLTFKGGKGIALTAGVDGITYTVKNCTFDGVQATAWKQGVISLNGNATVVVENNIITDVKNATEGDGRIDSEGQQSTGIYTNNAVEVTISGNTITNVDGTGISSNSNAGEVDIKDNKISAWGTGATAKNEGRAIRTSGGTEVAITGNVMIDNGTAKEEFVKATGMTVSFDASGNYWSGKNPLEEGIFDTDFAKDPAQIIVNYYTDAEKSNLVELAPSVAKIGDTYYATLDAAFKAATEGCSIDLLADVEVSESLNVSSNSAFDKINVTFNGNDKTIKAVGNTWNDNTWLADIAWNVTLNNVTFDGNNTGCKGVQFYTSTSTLNNITVKNVSADKWNSTDYAIHANASELTVTGSLTFEGCKHGMLMVDLGSNTGKVASVVSIADNATVNGVKVILNHKDASMKAPETAAAYVLIGDVEGYTMVYENGSFKLVEAVAKIGDTYYATLEAALNAAQPGETVTILAGDYTTNITINKAITVEGETDEQGNKLVNITGRVSAHTGATVKNLNVNNTKTGDYDCALNVNGEDIVVDGVNLTGHNAMRYCYASGDITIKNSTINGSYFAVHFDGSAGGNIVFENTDITGWASYASTVNSVSYKECKFDQGGYAGHRYYNKNISFNECDFEAGFLIDLEASGSNVAFTDTDMTVAEVKALFTDPYYVANGNVTLNNEQVTYAASGYTAGGSKYFDNLQDAIDEVINGGYITVRSNIELTEGVTVPAGKKITLGLNGYTITGTPTVAAEFAVITNNGNLTIDDAQNGKILCNHNLAPSTGYAVNTITNNGTLTVVAGTIENKSTYTSSNQIGYAIDNNSTTGNAVVTIKGGKVTASGSVYYDGIRQFCNSETLENNVTIEGGEVSTLWIQNPSNDNEKDVKGSFDITGGTLGNLYLEPSANFSGSISDGHVGNISRYQTAEGRDLESFITGGTFGMDVTEFCAFNYSCTQNTDGTYGVNPSTTVNQISNLNELIAFRNAVNAGNTFAGKVVTVKDNIDMSSETNWIPIGTSANPFKGTFDGGDKTISDLNVVGENNVGLFGYATEANIKNVKIVNANVKGTDCVAALIGQGYASTYIDNCHVSGSIKVEGQTNVGGIVGKYYARVTNSSVIGDGVATSYVKGTYEAEDFEGDNIGGIMGHAGENNTHSGNTVKNITISGTRKVGGLIGTTDRATDIDACLVDNVVIGCTADENYANDKASTTTLGGLVGNYYGESTGGTVTNTVVKNVTFNVGNAKNVGPIVGGNRTTPDAESIEGVTASGNLIYMSTITGSTNTYLMNAVAKIGETKYYTLQEAVDAGNGETINVIGNTTEVINIADNAVIDLNFSEGVTLNGYFAPFKGNLTINGGTINNENASYSAIEINAGTLVLNDVKVTSKRHGVRIDGAVTATIEGGEYRLSATSGTRHAVNVSGAANVTIKAGTFVGPAGTSMDSGSAVCVQAGAKVTIEGGDFSGGKTATLGVSGTMTVTGGTFDQDPSEYVAEGYLCGFNQETERYEVTMGVASVTQNGSTTYYRTLAEAITAVGSGEVVINLHANATLDYNAREAYGTAETTSLTINGDGKTLTLNQKDSDWSSFGLANADAKVVFNNMIIEKTGYGDTSGAWNTHAIIFSSNVEMTNVTVNNSMAVQDGATLNNVTINEANGYYGLWINGNGQSVTMNGGSINATNGGRGIKIADQYIDAPALVTLSVTGTTFNTAKKAAVLVSSKAGAAIAASNVDITNVAEDKVNFAWVDEDWAAHYGEVTVTGGTVSQESVEIFNVTITDNNNAIQGYYKNIATAIADAQAGETVNLLDNYNETLSEVLLIDKSLTINGNGKTLTSSATRVIRLTASDINVTINELNMVSKAVRVGTNDVRGISIDIIDNVTLTLNNCSVDFTDASANDWAYAVNVTGGNEHNVTVKGGTYEGANVINVRGENNTVIVEDATLTSLYPDNDMHYGATIWVLEENGSSVEATGNIFNGGNAVAFNLGTGTDLTESNNTDNTTIVVAKVDGTYYTSVNEAINAAADGATVQLLSRTISEAIAPWKTDTQHTTEKSITVKGYDNFGTTLTGGLYLGYDDSQCRNHTIVVEGIAFEGKGLTVACQKNVTIINNTFNNITDSRAIAVIGKDIEATVENNKIDGVQIGIELRNMADATMTGNEVKNTTHNSVQVTAANPDADVTITGNTFENWGKGGEGRAIRVSGGDNIDVNANKMVNANAPESFVKITKLGETVQAINASHNYWSGNNPLTLFETDGADDPVTYLIDYYDDAEMQNLITLSASIAKVGNEYYQSLQAAVDAAQANETVTLLDHATGAGVVINKNIIIDFGGFTYTVNQAVGSEGTKTLGFQILKNNNVTLKNGTLTSTTPVVAGKEVKMLIQNYANLTLTDMNLVDNTDHILYALSNNSGTSNINGATSITTTDAVAFDVYDYTAGGYAVPTVNVSTTGKITGAIEVSESISNNLNISAGTFTVEIAEAWCADGFIPKDNGDGTYGVEQGVFVARVNGKGYTTINAAIAAAQEGETVTILAGDYEQTLNINKAITVQGERNDQNENLVNITGKLNITANNATAKNLNVDNGNGNGAYINAKDVTVDGCTVVGGNGFRSCYTTGLVTFKNSTITGSTYGIHFDGSADGNIVIENCDITGWTSFASTITNVAISNTEFLNGNYNQLRFYQNAQMTNCKFNEAMTIDFGMNDVNAEFEGCAVVDTEGNETEAPLTDVIYLGDIAEMGIDVTIDNETVVVESRITRVNGENEEHRYFLELTDALADVKDGETITLFADINEAVNVKTLGKEIVFDGNDFTMTAGMSFGNDDNNGDNGKITVKKVNFANANAKAANNGLTLIELAEVTVDNCNFTNITGDAIAVISDNLTETITITNNVIDGATGAGINLRTPKAATVENNVIKNVGGNAMTFQHDSNRYDAEGDIIVTGNLMENWANNAAEGRAIRLASGSKARTFTIENNAMVKANAPEEFVKITTSEDAQATISIDKNYWNGQSPLNENVYLAEGVFPTNYYGEYQYANETLTLSNLVSINYVAQVNGVKYPSLAAAVEAAQAGETVTLLGDATGAGVVINKNIIIDFGGFTYTVNQAVGSEGTKTLGFQILKNNNVTLKNGTLTSTTPVVAGKEVKMLIQNYANLTLTDMNLVDNTDHILYALSNNSGTSNINGATSITTTDAVAFDVYDYTAGGYAVPTVNVSTTGTIAGAIVVSETATLNISAGTFTVEIEEAWCADGFIPKDNGDGTWTVKVGQYVARIGGTGYETLDEAFAAAQNGNEVKILVAGTYALNTSGKDITITGAVDGVVFDNIGAKNMGGANVTFNNVTFDYYPNVNYTGLQHSGDLVYNNCTINGQVFLYGTSETFNECIFNQNSADAYNVWTYGAKDVDFIECTFNSVGKSVLIYAEGASIFNNVNVTKCTFNASAPVDGKAAIEMDSSLTAGINLTIDDATTATGFDNGNVSGNSLWNNKKGNETEANNDITVVVNDETVLAPLTLVAAAGGTNYTSLQAAYNAVAADGTITILNDVTGAGLVIDKNVTIDFNEKTYTFNEGVGSGTLTSNGFQILQGNDVVLKNGTLNVNADDADEFYILVQNYADLTIEDMNLDGTNLDKWSLTDGDSYVLSNNSGEVNITGATNITANNEGDKAFAFDVCKYGSYAAPTVNVNTTGIIDGKIEVSSEIPTNLNISGGTFTVEIEEAWCAEGFIPVKNADNTWTVKVGKFIAQTETGAKFETLQEAVNAGTTVTLLDHATGAGVVIDKNVTIDFGGKTYTVNQAVGSSGTETLGFQILKNNDVTLKNGTLISTAAVEGSNEIKMLIQNYANLTLTDMNLVDNTDHILYALSNNSGTSNINGATSITTTDAVAFDVYDYTAGGYAVPTVNVSTTGKITGAIVVSESINNNLNISAGTFTNEIYEEWCAEFFSPYYNETDKTWTVVLTGGVQTIQLGNGWNWFSSYVDMSGENGLATLQDALGTSGRQIKSQVTNHFSSYSVENQEWYGNSEFTSLHKEKMYMIQTSADVELELSGDFIDYEETPIQVNKGWNWISYPVNETVDINEALKNLNASDNDIVKMHGATFATYYGGKWLANNVVMTLEPGQGYMYYRKASDATSFVYNVPAENNNNKTNVAATDYRWTSASAEYANNMTITAMLSVDGELVRGDYEIAALVNGEVRGNARPVYIESLDAYMLFMTVFGDDVEEVTFRYYDVETGAEFDLDNNIIYSTDAIVGSIEEPYMFNLDILNIGETSIDEINVYPNPTTIGREISLDATCDTVEVFNALGVKVAEYHNVDSIDAIETAGIYVIRVTIDGNARNCRLVVK